MHFCQVQGELILVSLEAADSEKAVMKEKRLDETYTLTLCRKESGPL